MLSALKSQGFVVEENFISPVVAEKLRQLAVAKYEADEFSIARIGRADSIQTNSQIRRDKTLWLDFFPDHDVWHQLETLRQRINHEFYLGLAHWEGHFSVYEPGDFYGLHLDCHKSSDARVLSMVLYLDEQPEGGELRLKLNATSSEKIRPSPGKLVLFLSSEIWHEVLPCKTRRVALSGWFRRSGLL